MHLPPPWTDPLFHCLDCMLLIKSSLLHTTHHQYSIVLLASDFGHGEDESERRGKTWSKERDEGKEGKKLFHRASTNGTVAGNLACEGGIMQ